MLGAIAAAQIALEEIKRGQKMSTVAKLSVDALKPTCSTYWTFPEVSGRWRVRDSDRNVLENGAATLRVGYWDGPIPYVDTGAKRVPGTVWIDGLAVQQGVTAKPEKSGGSVDYYKVRINNPTSGGDAYTAECNDVIESLGMNYAEGNAFKAIWRSCAERTLGKMKAGGDALYDAEKVVFFGNRMVTQRGGNNAPTI